MRGKELSREELDGKRALGSELRVERVRVSEVVFPIQFYHEI